MNFSDVAKKKKEKKCRQNFAHDHPLIRFPKSPGHRVNPRNFVFNFLFFTPTFISLCLSTPDSIEKTVD